MRRRKSKNYTHPSPPAIKPSPFPPNATHIYATTDDIIKTNRRANPKQKFPAGKSPNANAARAVGQNKARRDAAGLAAAGEAKIKRTGADL